MPEGIALTADQKAWLNGTKSIPSSQRLWECYALLSKHFEYIPDFKVSVDGDLQPATHTVVSTGAYNDLMSGNRAYGPKKDAYGNKVKLFSTVLADCGTLNAVLSHFIATTVWGPDGPQKLDELYGQALTSNKHDQGRKGGASDWEMRIGLKLKGDSLALRLLEMDVGKVWIVKTAHQTYSYEENVSPKRFAEMAAKTVKLFKATKTLVEAALILRGEIKELDEDKVRYILMGQSPREPVSGSSYVDFKQPVTDYVVKTAQEAIKDKDDGVPNLRAEKGLTTDIAKIYKCAFRFGRGPTKPAIILGELLNSIMEDACKEVRDQLMQDDKSDKATLVLCADSSFVLDQECLLAVGIVSNLPVGCSTRHLKYTASDQLEYISWSELRAIGTVAGMHNTETPTEHQLVDSGLFDTSRSRHLTPLIQVFGARKTQERIESALQMACRGAHLAGKHIVSAD